MSNALERRNASRIHRLIVASASVWAMVGWAVALWPLDPSSEPILIAAAILFPAFAALGSWLAWRRAYGWAAVMLLLSIGTPTYFVWPLLLVPVVLAVFALKCHRESRHA